MNDENVAVEQAVETDTTQTSSPEVESPITGDETVQGEAVVQTPVVEESEPANMTEEQRRAFQEMRQENKRLKEERESRPRESAFDSFRAQAPVNLAPVSPQNFTDEYGQTNWQAYNQAQATREQALLSQAKNEARSEIQEVLDEREARTKFPELMSNPVTEEQIAAKWLYEKVQGRNVSVLEIAEQFSRNFKQAVSKAEKIGAERVLNEVSEKEKAGLTATGQSSQGANRAASQEDAYKLSVGTRRGESDAITARISKIPWANK